MGRPRIPVRASIRATLAAFRGPRSAPTGGHGMRVYGVRLYALDVRWSVEGGVVTVLEVIPA